MTYEDFEDFLIGVYYAIPGCGKPDTHLDVYIGLQLLKRRRIERVIQEALPPQPKRVVKAQRVVKAPPRPASAPKVKPTPVKRPTLIRSKRKPVPITISAPMVVASVNSATGWIG